MPRIAMIAAAAMLGVVALLIVGQEFEADKGADQLASVEMAGKLQSQMRLCVGPARVTLGGEPFVGLAFGGDGCGKSAAELVGVRIITSPAASPGTVAEAFLDMMGVVR